MPDIKIPTFFLYSLDDPIVTKECIDYEMFDRNENLSLGTTQYGGHLGYNESLFDLKNKWFLKLAFKFLNQYK